MLDENWEQLDEYVIGGYSGSNLRFGNKLVHDHVFYLGGYRIDKI